MNYIDLIQTLLNSPIGEEINILRAYPDLIERQFVTTLLEMAENYRLRGELDTANRLRNIAAYLLQVAPNSESQMIDFLRQVLIAVEKNPSPESIYPLLQYHQDKLNDNFAEFLYQCAINTFPTLESEQVYQAAGVIFKFGNLIQQFPLGNRKSNLEIAIKAYQAILQVFTPENSPYYWAQTQNNLATAYFKRIRGDKAENLEMAINYDQDALKVFTFDAFPYEWANTQNNLATAYHDRIRGDKADNLEMAISYDQNALKVFTFDSFPYEWATTQNNLAVAYYNRIRGDKADNLEMAISYYQNALKVINFDAFPYDWAYTNDNLAIAYCQRIKGDKADNLEKAISYSQNALKVYNFDTFPYDWAYTQNNLATTYYKRIRGDKADNLEMAITCDQNALKVFTFDAFPQDWAYTQNNLATTYSKRIRGDKADNLETAIACYQNALTVRTFEAFPQDWAQTENNLALAYSSRIKGDKTDNLEKAIACYRQSLTVYTPESDPLECLRNSRNLGNLGFKMGNWQIAMEGYQTAIEAVEMSRNWATTDERRTDLLAENIDVYFNMVQACINNNQLDQALEYVERSRSKRLVDIMAVNDLYKGGEIPPQIQQYFQEHEEIQKEINARQSFLQSDDTRGLVGSRNTITSASLTAIQQEIETLEAQKQQAYQAIRRYSLELAAQLQVNPLKLAEIQQLIKHPKTAILSFYTTRQDTHIFILLSDQLKLHTCTGESIEVFQDWIYDNWFIPYLTSKQQWRNNMEKFLSELSQRLKINELINQHLTDIEELIIVPHLLLHQIPFAALPLEEIREIGEIKEIEETTRIAVGNTLKKNRTRTNPDQTTYLGERFRLRILPSCQILNFCHQRDQLQGADMGIVEDATSDLPFTRYECQNIAKTYQVPPDKHLQGQQATFNNVKQLLKQVNRIHTSHHAATNWNDPLDSHLLLADEEKITLAQLLTWKIDTLLEVFMCCCETNLTLTKITDEPLTLATGFLTAGARSVVSTLWAVEDLGSALLSTLYYQLRFSGLSSSLAMQTAQYQLRTLTGPEFAAKYKTPLEDYLKKVELDSSKRLQLERNLNQYCQEKYPFAAPYYWAGFISQGL